MSIPSRAIPAANAKLNRLCAESERRGGSLTNYGAVARAIGLAPSRISQLFGASNPGAEQGITPKTLGALARVFTQDGVPLTIDTFYLDYASFVSRVADVPDPSVPSHAPIPPGEALTSLPSTDWIPDRAEAYTKLATAQLHAARPLNSRPGCYYLDVSLRFDAAEYPAGDATIIVGLRNATLVIASEAYQIAHMSLLGDAARPLDGIAITGTGITVSALAGTSMLSGNPIGEHYLAVIEPVESEGTESTVTVTLHAARRAFVFSLLDQDGAPAVASASSTKDAILNLIYGETLDSRRDATTGHFGLGSATMRYTGPK